MKTINYRIIAIITALLFSSILLSQDNNKEINYFFKNQQGITTDSNLFFALYGFYAPESVTDIESFGYKKWQKTIENNFKNDNRPFSLSPLTQKTTDSIKIIGDNEIGNIHKKIWQCIYKKDITDKIANCIPQKRVEYLKRANYVLLQRYRNLTNYKIYQAYGFTYRQRDLIAMAQLDSLIFLNEISTKPKPDKLIKRQLNIAAYFFEISQKKISSVEKGIFLVVSGLQFSPILTAVEETPQLALFIEKELAKTSTYLPERFYGETGFNNDVRMFNAIYCTKEQWLKGLNENCLNTGNENTKKEKIDYKKLYKLAYNHSINLKKLFSQKDLFKDVHGKYNSNNCKTSFSKLQQKTTRLNDKNLDNLLINLLINGNINSCDIAYNWAVKKARYKMLYAFTMMVKEKVKPKDIPEYIKKHTELFTDPISLKTMTYDKKSGKIMLPAGIDAREHITIKYK